MLPNVYLQYYFPQKVAKGRLFGHVSLVCRTFLCIKLSEGRV